MGKEDGIRNEGDAGDKGYCHPFPREGPGLRVSGIRAWAEPVNSKSMLGSVVANFLSGRRECLQSRCTLGLEVFLRVIV